MTSVNPTDATDAPEREELTWERFGTATRELAEVVAADGWRPDIVVAVARGGLTREEALARLARQMPLEEKRKYADFIIDTSGAKEETLKLVWETFKVIRSIAP